LRAVHEALADAARAGELADLAKLPVWSDARRWIEVAPLLDAKQRSWMTDLHDRVSERIVALGLPSQPIHGDAHPGNVLVTAEGATWTDFEEGGRWPVEWDLACILNASVILGLDVPACEAMVRAYGRDPHDPILEPFHVARSIVAAAWMAVTGNYRGTFDPSRLTARLAWLERRAVSRSI
jgi:Ser/Thr protein kinase RdoA (MazF antagonist)